MAKTETTVRAVVGSPLGEVDQTALGRAAQIAANTCIYLESAIPDHLPRKRGTGVGDVYADGPGRWEIGRELKLSTELHLAGGDPTRRGSFQVHHRFVVRGHWRNQAVGPLRSRRERIWIKPHFKGPEDAQVIHRTYAVD